MILEIFCSGPVFTNCVLLGCSKTKKAAIIDAPLGSLSLLLPRIEELKLIPEMLLLTHSHWDHMGDAAAIKKRLGIPLYVHQLDAPNLLEPGSDRIPMIRVIDRVEADYFLEEGQKLLLGELKIEVIHTPGHTPGGVCFYLPEEDTLISGDTLFQGSIGNISFSTGEPDKMWKSLEKLAKLPRATRVIPGHGEETTIGDEPWLIDAKKYFGG